MNIAIVHDNLNLCGGAEKLAISTILALKEAGHNITLVTSENPNWSKIEAVFGESVYVDSIITMPFNLKISKTYRSILLAFLKRKLSHDIIFNTNGDTVPMIWDTLTYIHYPNPLFLSPDDEAWEYNGVLWNFYYAPSRIAQRIMLRSPDSRSTIITNSNFTRGKIRSAMKRDAIVVYPPVDIQKYTHLVENKDRDDCVTVISRFTPDKNLPLIPELANRLKCKFVVIGTKAAGADSIIFRLKKRISELGIEDRVTLLPNAPHMKKIESLVRSKVYLHLKKYEHFGISIVEAMAAGCTPITYDGGGPREFVPDKWRYITTEEIADKIQGALDSWSEAEARRNSSIASRFDESIYKQNIMRIIDNIKLEVRV